MYQFAYKILFWGAQIYCLNKETLIRCKQFLNSKLHKMYFCFIILPSKIEVFCTFGWTWVFLLHFTFKNKMYCVTLPSKSALYDRTTIVLLICWILSPFCQTSFCILHGISHLSVIFTLESVLSFLVHSSILYKYSF